MKKLLLVVLLLAMSSNIYSQVFIFKTDKIDKWSQNKYKEYDIENTEYTNVEIKFSAPYIFFKLDNGDRYYFEVMSTSRADNGALILECKKNIVVILSGDNTKILLYDHDKRTGFSFRILKYYKL